MDGQTDNYISLQEATKYCIYSQEYLSLRARQGKLKAEKFGRNWVTKEEWLEEYLAGVGEYNNKLNNKLNNLETKKEIAPPKNLPVGEPKLIPVFSRYEIFRDSVRQFAKQTVLSPSVRFGFAFGMVLVLIITGAVFGRDSLKEVMAGLSAPIKESFVSVYEDIENEFSRLGRKIDEDEIYSAAVYGTIETYQEYFEWLGNTLGEQISKVENSAPVLVVGKTAKNVWNPAKTGYTVADNFIEKKLSVIADSAYKFSQFFNQGAKGIKKIAFGVSKKIAKFFSKPVAKEGMVVVPSTEKDEEVKAKIKAAFSDEVEVKPKDKESGIIVPIFRERIGEDYMYILVPIKSVDK